MSLGISVDSCKRCGKTFTGYHNLNKHMEIHSGTKPYRCEVCNRGFYGRGKLNRHLRMHGLGTGPPVECHICNRRFVTKCGLEKHLLLHTGEKPFPCSQCTMAFRCAGNLKRHAMAKHTGEFRR